MKGVTPILVAKPDDETRQGDSASPRGPYKHIVEAKGRDEVLAWAVERPDGGRGFGFTGGHFHKNWGNPELPQARPQRHPLDGQARRPLRRASSATSPTRNSSRTSTPSPPPPPRRPPPRRRRID